MISFTPFCPPLSFPHCKFWLFWNLGLELVKVIWVLWLFSSKCKYGFIIFNELLWFFCVILELFVQFSKFKFLIVDFVRFGWWWWAVCYWGFFDSKRSWSGLAKENKFWSFPLFEFFLLFLFIWTVERFHLNLDKNDPSWLFSSWEKQKKIGS